MSPEREYYLRMGLFFLLIFGIFYTVYHESKINESIDNKVIEAINNNASRSCVIKIISSECDKARSWIGSSNSCKQFIASKHFEFLELNK